MSLFQEIKTRVKNTFLELVEDEEEEQPRLTKAKTDSVALRVPRAPSDDSCPEGVREEVAEQSCDDSVEDGKENSGRPLTTVMLRNLPNDLTRDMLMELLDARGFAGRYDFLYLPVDFSRRAGLGYAFVNMLSDADAQGVRARLEGFKRWRVPSGKVCSVGWSNPTQGRRANLERYRNSSVMHDSVPDEFKPVLLADGKRIPFPRPTKILRMPGTGKTGRPRA